jgi:spermidine synthase
MAHRIDIREEAGIRYLHFGTDWVQGAMRISRPNQLVLAYTQEMLAFLLFRDPPRRVLMIGLGAGSLARFFRHRLPEAHCTVVEINPHVVAIAQQFFKVPAADARLDVEIGDGFDYVARSRATFDAILVDGYDHHARAGRLESLPFYAACRARLPAQGVLVTNVFGRVRGHGQTKRNLGEAFAGNVVLLPSAEASNVLATAFRKRPEPLTVAELRERAALLRTRYGLPFQQWVPRLQQADPPGTRPLFR